MRRSVLRLWLGAGLVTGVMICGCRQFDRSAPAGHADGLVIETMPQLNLQSKTGFQCSCAVPQTSRTSTEPPLHEMALPAVDPDSRETSGGPVLIPTSAREETVSKVSLPTQPVPQSSGAHHSEYLWLVGVLERGPEMGTWSVRYANPQEEDRYGGRLTLVAPSPILGYRAGQMVRVQGHVVQEMLRTEYQVERIETLGKN